jgi:predicted ATP-grasp superfamily ATP-dependent carboligase
MEKKKSQKVIEKANSETDNVGEPVIPFTGSKVLTEEEKAVRNSLGRISINARRKAYRKKSAVTIIRNGKILRIHSNRKVKSIGVVKKIEVEGDITKPIKIK